MGLRKNILLKRTIFISLVGLSLLITTGIVLIFMSSYSRDSRYIKVVRLAGDLESEILKTRIAVDEIIIHNNNEYSNELVDRFDSLRSLLNELHVHINSSYSRYAGNDFFHFDTRYDTVISRLNILEQHVNEGNFLRNDGLEASLFSTFNGFNLAYQDYEQDLSRLQLMDNNRYKLEIIGIVILNLIFLSLAGYMIIRLYNQLIQADRDLVRKTIEVEKRERERIAADLHDSLGSLLSGIIIHLQVLEKKYADDPALKNQLRHLNTLSNSAINGIEEVINNLNPSLLSRYGLVKSLERITARVNGLGKTEFSIDSKELNIEFPDSTELILFRICSELINNALKHSIAKKASFKFFNIKKEFHLLYRDDGIGFAEDHLNVEEKKGGLYNLIRRVESMEGTFRIESEPGEGVEIEIILNIGK